MTEKFHGEDQIVGLNREAVNIAADLDQLLGGSLIVRRPSAWPDSSNNGNLSCSTCLKASATEFTVFE
jgi:hypothetical protein